jgi:branched-chain amino acid transport system ATP-binding protein
MRAQTGAAPALETAPLAVDGVSKSFGGVHAVREVSFAVAPATLTCLIGPNGAGKSTLLQCIAGLLQPDSGSIRVVGQEVARWTPHARARAGLGTVFQATRPIPTLNVLENVMVGCHAWTRKGFLAGIVRPPAQRREERAIAEAAREALALVGLERDAAAPADALPFGKLRLLAIARVLAQRPQVLLLDEPVAGLRAGEKARVVEVFHDLRERGFTQILVEHDMRVVGSTADRVIVLDRGATIADGTADEVRRDEAVVAAYLGTETL